MTFGSLFAVDDHDRPARRNAFVLAAAQALYGSGATIIITLGGLVGHDLATDKSLATLPITSYVLGTAMLTVPISLYMRVVGRRVGFITGTAFGAASAALSVYAIFAQSFWMFCLATLLSGGYQASAMYYRFAAADTASPSFRARAISWVLAGGVAAAFLGPQTVIWTKDALAPAMLAGSFAAAVGLSVLAAGLLTLLRIPHPRDVARGGTPRPLRRILARPALPVAILCGMVSYGIMNLVMTATPLAMVGAHHSIDDAAFVIQWHVLAMFAPSFFTGNLINRFGVRRVMAAGLALLAGCGAVALTGTGLAHFWGALVLLGLGWNFAFVGATKLVTDCHRPSERAKVQALNDLFVFATVALASLSSGTLLHWFGWSAVVLTLFPLVAFAAVLVGWLALVERRGAQPVASRQLKRVRTGGRRA